MSPYLASPEDADLAKTVETLAKLELWFDPKVRLLICSRPTCKYALSTKSAAITSHLRDKHRIPPQARKGLSRLLKTLDLRNPKEVGTLADASPEHPQLKLHDGFACRQCQFKTIHLPAIKRHFSDPSASTCPNNAVSNTGRSNTDDLFEYVYLQTWTTGSSRKYWIIEQGGNIARPVNDQRTDEHLMAVHKREMARHQGARDKRLNEEAKQISISPNPAELSFGEQRLWIERTGWEKTYRGKSRQVLLAMTETPIWYYQQGHSLRRPGQAESGQSLVSPPEDERIIAGIACLVDVLMDRCEETAQKTNRNVLCWLRSNRPHSSYPKPFMLVRQRATRQRYRRLWKRLLAFVLRVYRLDADTQKSIVGVRLRSRLRATLERLWAHPSWSQADVDSRQPTAEDITPSDDDYDVEDESDGSDEVNDDVDSAVDDDSGEASDADDDEDDDIFPGSESEDAWEPEEGEVESLDGTVPRPIATQEKFRLEDIDEGEIESLIELLFGLSLALCTEPLVDSQPSSTILVYFSGILGFSTNDSYRFLPARIYTSCLSGLIYIQRLLFLERALPLRPYPTLGIERRPRLKQLDRLRKIRQRYMVIGSPSAFEEFLSLRSYGRVMAQTETPATLLYWSDDRQTVSWGEEPQLSMSQFRQLPEHLIREASRLCSELMYGWEPAVDLSKITDKMSNHEVGYSFVNDPDNGLGEAYLELFKYACTSRKAPLSRGDHWDPQAVAHYFKKEESFRQHLGLAMHLTGGQLPRWTELLSLWCENTEFGERGIYVHQGSLIYVTRHHKAKRSTNREFIVARFLPAEISHLLYKYCAFIRGFVNMLDRERNFAGSNGLRSSALLFRARAASGSKPWQTSQLTKLLKKVTTTMWGYPVHSQLLRQLCIGITEKHVCEVYRPFNRFDDTSDDAHRNVVFAWQSGHRPLQRGRTYGLDGAFPTKLQPQLLDLHQCASTKWHEFLHLPSKLAKLASYEPNSNHQLVWLQTSGTQVQTQARKRKRDDVEVAASETRLMSSPQHGSLQHQGHHINPRARAEFARLPWSSSPLPLPCRQQQPEIRGQTYPGCTTRPSSPQSISGHSTSPPVELGEMLLGRQENMGSPRPEEMLSARSLFGCLNEIASIGEIEERRSILQFLSKFHTTEANGFYRQEQLARVVQTVEWWGLVGCPACFVATGRHEPDHDIYSCERGIDSERARRILQWMETLAIPLSYESNWRGDCSICAPFHPCREVAYGIKVAEAGSSDEKEYWLKMLAEEPGPDGCCEHRPIIRQVIAALCAYDNQSLGKLITKLASDRDGLDLTIEPHARRWFEREIGLIQDFQFSNLLHIYEFLVRAFYFRQNKSQGLDALWGFPDQPPAQRPHITRSSSHELASWDNTEEVGEWQASLDWWTGKCSFCAGRGLQGSQILHTLRQCRRGGATKLKSELAIAMYYDGILPSSGCGHCHIPFDFCDSWARRSGGKWKMAHPGHLQCQYDQNLMADTIIGLYYCGKTSFKGDLLDNAEAYNEAEDLPMDYSEETVACSLAQCVTVEGVDGSEMIQAIYCFHPSFTLHLVEFSASIWATEETLNELEGTIEGQEDAEDNNNNNNNREFEMDSSEDDGRRRLAIYEDRLGRGRNQGRGHQFGAGDHWTSMRMTRLLRRMSLVGCKKGITLSSWRHISIAFARRYFRNPTTAQAKLIQEGEMSGSDDDDEVEDSPWDIQAGHGSLIAGLVYGCLITEGSLETNERRVNFRMISEEWHRLLGFPSAIRGFGEILKPGRKRKNASFHHEAVRELQLRRWKTLRRINIDRELGRLYRDQARFRGLQREAVDAIMKSLCFMFPAASCPGGLTVVVVPLVSLQGNMLERCQKMNISYAEWKSDRVPGDVSIIFVTPESAMTKRF
ncbi:Fc.00g073240.m01.CDS01 [Cosmosporella sp. VM-42]